MQKTLNIMNNSCLYIDTDILKKNISALLASLPEGTQLIPVLKDDAYGLGLMHIASVLASEPEINTLAVAHVSEGLELRENNIIKNILILGSALPFQLESAVKAKLTLAAGSAEFVRGLEETAAALNIPAQVHVKIDSGLHRIGVEPGEELDELISVLNAAPHIIVRGVFSHFSDTSDAELTHEQYCRFLQGVAQLEKAGYTGLLRHISSSAAHELYPQYSLDAVRIGRALYMDSPDGVSHGIEELASWRTYITAVKMRRAGDSLGYGGAFHLEHDAKVATIGIGYGDGLNQDLCRVHAPLLIGGRLCPLLACCMDQCFADVSGLDCAPGDSVTVFGSDGAGNFLSSQAQALLIGGDEGCGLTSALSTRVKRIYSDGD